MSLETKYLALMNRYHAALYKIERLLELPYASHDANIEERGAAICNAIQELKEKK